MGGWEDERMRGWGEGRGSRDSLQSWDLLFNEFAVNL